jgi:hypothetical protein
VKAVVVGVGVAPEVQHRTAQKPVAERIAQLAQAAELGGPRALPGLHLDGGDRSVVAFEDQIDLVAVVSAPVPDCAGVSIQPACLSS